MKAEIINLAKRIEQSQAQLRRYLDWDNALRRLDELNSLTSDPGLWNDAKHAQTLLRERNHLSELIGNYQELDKTAKDSLELAEMGEAEGDNSIVSDAEAELGKVADKLRRLELESLLSGEADANDCFIEIHPGAGGTESQDWASILLRMYMRWAEKAGFKMELIDEQAGEEAGIKSATIKVSGHNAYGWAKTESGVHRLVRISPFDSNARRHTSFASVWVYPMVDDTIEVEINEKDLRVDTFRASGAGGQHVNKTDSAIRITHMPTNIVVQCQTSRSQHKNRAEAYSMLRARLYELELQKREEKANALNATKTDNAWGHQIRSYVLHPYQMIKDLRTDVETSNTQAVLDGDLEAFMSAALADRVKGKSEMLEGN
ncbi:MAG TPA: peptide chain release factor 2 [Rickettsiales bacterium]|nr:peptide chain release factor 2 [Rickettsiales bacterium]